MPVILSIDGGGVRGKFDIKIIDLLEQSMGKRAYDIFDLVVGVSAGAATAAGVALRLYGSSGTKYKSITDVSEGSNLVFKNPLPNGPLEEVKYDGYGKTAFLKQIFGDKVMGDAQVPLAILVATMNGNPKVFTSWDAKHKHLPVWLVLNATTAAPIYFPPVCVEGRYYIDGGAISNDPSLVGIIEARELWGNSGELSLLSLGTGFVTDVKITENYKDAHPESFGLLKWLQSGLVEMMMRSNNVLLRHVIPLLLKGKGNYVRITSTVAANMDDTTPQTTEFLNADAVKIWKSDGARVVRWLKEKI